MKEAITEIEKILIDLYGYDSGSSFTRLIATIIFNYNYNRIWRYTGHLETTIDKKVIEDSIDGALEYVSRACNRYKKKRLEQAS